MSYSRHKVIIKLDSPSGNLMIRKMIVRTSSSIWSEIYEPIILPFCIHSAINEGITGQFNISALLRVIKSNSKEKVTVLMCDGAHLNVLKLQYKGDIEAAKNKCRIDTERLLQRFKDELKDCTVLFWGNFVNGHIAYEKFLNEVKYFYENDLVLRLAIKEEARLTYTHLRASQYPDKLTYIKNAELDLLEMIVFFKIMYDRGYKINIYPGNMPKAIIYLQPYLYPTMVCVKAMIKQVELKTLPKLSPN